MSTESPYTNEPPTDAGPTSDDRTWAMLCHIASFAGYVVPFGNVVCPLVIWLLKKDQSEFVDHHGKESLNFQITMTIAAIIAGISILFLIGILLLPAVLLFSLIVTIVAAIKASNGEYYHYPLCIALIR